MSNTVTSVNLKRKKYQRKQIARLIAITTLKSIFSIQEIAQTLNTLHTDTNSEELYNAFVDYMNEDIDPANPIIQASCQNGQTLSSNTCTSLYRNRKGGNK